MPIDVVKTRLQMDGSGGVKQYSGSVDCATKLVRAEGPSSLFKGLPPALVRQSTYGSLRYGLYGPIKDSMGVLGFGLGLGLAFGLAFGLWPGLRSVLS